MAESEGRSKPQSVSVRNGLRSISSCRAMSDSARVLSRRFVIEFGLSRCVPFELALSPFCFYCEKPQDQDSSDAKRI